ncbi:MAG: carbonate dehydratase [Gammaproteobacteria bacterium]|nr:carbonate dehydratase [Gammaproteobacteria bacterium]
MLDHLFQNNIHWSERMTDQDPAFFQKLLNQQTPEYLWIGCADSRVPANEIVDLMPGELFVHRNVANVVVHTDLNCLSVLQYAVDVLKVKHIIVCGHYGCGGIRAALNNDRLGLIDNWLRHVQDVRKKYEAPLLAIADDTHRSDKLCELNVVEQVVNVCETTIIQDAWARGQQVAVHSWIYGLNNGRVQDLGMCVTERDALLGAYDSAIRKLVHD